MLHRFCIGPTPLRRGSPLAPVHLTRPQAFTERQTHVPDCIRGQKSACTPHRHRVRTRRSFSPSMLAARAMSLRLPYTTCVRYLHCENDVLRPGHQLPSSRGPLLLCCCAKVLYMNAIQPTSNRKSCFSPVATRQCSSPQRDTVSSHLSPGRYRTAQMQSPRRYCAPVVHLRTLQLKLTCAISTRSPSSTHTMSPRCTR